MSEARAAENLCDALFIPDGYELTCTIEGGAGEHATKAIVEPTDTSFGELSSLTLRELDREDDAQAWSEPAEWVRSQLVVNINGLSEALDDLADNPDNPLGGPSFTTAVQSAISVLRDWSQLALRGCDDVVERDAYIRLRCEWAAASLALYVQVLLIEAGDARFAVNIRTMNERRLQHLEAIANSFDPSI